MVYATDENFNNIVNNKLVLVDFYASWCGPCTMQSEVLEKLNSSRSNRHYDIVKVNVDECRSLSEKFNIESIPTLLVLKDGEILNRHVGYMDINSLSSMMEQYKKA